MVSRQLTHLLIVAEWRGVKVGMEPFACRSMLELHARALLDWRTLQTVPLNNAMQHIVRRHHLMLSNIER